MLWNPLQRAPASPRLFSDMLVVPSSEKMFLSFCTSLFLLLSYSHISKPYFWLDEQNTHMHNRNKKTEMPTAKPSQVLHLILPFSLISTITLPYILPPIQAQILLPFSISSAPASFPEAPVDMEDSFTGSVCYRSLAPAEAQTKGAGNNKETGSWFYLNLHKAWIRLSAIIIES